MTSRDMIVWTRTGCCRPLPRSVPTTELALYRPTERTAIHPSRSALPPSSLSSILPDPRNCSGSSNDAEVENPGNPPLRILTSHKYVLLRKISQDPRRFSSSLHDFEAENPENSRFLTSKVRELVLLRKIFLDRYRFSSSFDDFEVENPHNSPLLISTNCESPLLRRIFQRWKCPNVLTSSYRMCKNGFEPENPGNPPLPTSTNRESALLRRTFRHRKRRRVLMSSSYQTWKTWRSHRWWSTS